MYTRCPNCQTVFILTPSQLKARDGLTRCGQCTQVFRADKHLLDDAPPGSSAHAAPGGHDPGRARRAGHSRKSASRPAAQTKERTAKKGKSAPIGPAGRPPGQKTLPLGESTHRTRPVFWMLGNFLLLLVLLGQVVFFYGGELSAGSPELRAGAEQICRMLGCPIRPRQDVRLIDLADARVGPHPTYDQALRVRATLVNRAGFVQPYPLLEVTLTDSEGVTIARRSFAPAEYLGKTAAPQNGMPVNVAVAVSLDVTQPTGRGVGYEIRLLPAH